MLKQGNTLVILTPGWASSEADTNCLPMQQQFVRALKENYPGLNIIILSFQYPFFKKVYQWQGITVHSFGGKNKGGLQRLMLRQRVYPVLKKIHQTHDICGLLSFWYGECAWVGKRFADKHRLKHYCWILGQDARKGNKYVKYLMLKGDELIALSDFLQDEFEKNHGVRPAQIVPPGIDTKQLTGKTEKDIDIIAAGSLIPLKQYGVLIDVISELKEQRPSIKTVLIGDGPEKEKLQAMITSKDLDGQITLTGELPHPEVLQWMQRGKVFIHPSSYEGFGVVCIEALQAACHVISFCRPMKQDIEHWYIVNSKEAMKQKTLEVLQKNHTFHSPSFPFLIEDTAKAFADLFI